MTRSGLCSETRVGVEAAVAADRRARQLAQQERVPAGRGVAGAALRVVGARREPPDHGRGAVLAQRLQVEQGAVRRRVAAERLERLVRLLRAARDDERDGDPLEPVREVDQDVERRAVGPVGVVDEQGQRPVRRQVRGQPVEGVPGGVRIVEAIALTPGSSSPRTGAAKRAAPVNRSVVSSRSTSSKSWRTTPNANARSSSAPRARRVSRPRRGRGRARGVEQRRLAHARRRR